MVGLKVQSPDDVSPSHAPRGNGMANSLIAPNPAPGKMLSNPAHRLQPSMMVVGSGSLVSMVRCSQHRFSKFSLLRNACEESKS